MTGAESRWSRLIRDRIVGRKGRYAAVALAVLIVAGVVLAMQGPAPEAADAVAVPESAAVAERAEAAAAEPPGEPAPAAEPTEAPAPPRAHPPGPRPVPKPDAVKGIYLNAWAAGSPRKLAKLIDLADRTEVNAFVIDVKEAGEISYDSRVPLVEEIGADRRYIRDVRGLLARLKEHGIYPIARIVVFKDPVLAQARPEWSIQHADSGVWKDNKGYLWVDSYNKDVWDYNIAIAREAIELGFAEVQWDYVRFPDVPRSYMRTAVWPARAGRAKDDAIREFIVYSKERLADLEVPITADIFGLVTSVADDMGIGQQWEKLVDVTDVLLPMVYPSHYIPGNYGLRNPNASPYETVLAAMRDAVRRSEPFAERAVIRPWLQDFTLGPPRYGAEQVRAQIQAVYDAGLAEWVLWNPGSNYTPGALALADGTPPNLGSAPKPAAPEPADGPKLLGEPIRPDTVGAPSGR